MLKNKKIILTGGGTAGHVFPILAVADILQKKDIDILYLGTPFGIERKLVGKKIPYQWILSGKLRRYVSLVTLWDLIKLFLGILVAVYRVWKYKPDLVFLKGGYVSLPALIAARLLNVKIVNHESDIVLGMANRLAHRWADKTCFGFDLIQYQGIDVKKSIYTGTPSHPGFLKNFHRKNRGLFGFRKEQSVLLVLGGSQGSRSINRFLEGMLKDFLEQLQIIHMTGQRDYKRYCQIRSKLPFRLKRRYFVTEFLDERQLPVAFALADLVVARSGASTLVDITLAKKPAILIPLPWSAGNHQEKNAKIYTRQDAAVKLSQKGLTSQKFFNTVMHLINDRADLKLMSKRIGRMAEPRAAMKIVNAITKELR